MLSERPFKLADQKTERGKILNPEYNIFRDQPTPRASPLRINTLLSGRNGNQCVPEGLLRNKTILLDAGAGFLQVGKTGLVNVDVPE